MLLPIDTDRLGLIATGHVEPVMPWIEGPDGKRRPGETQERDEATGLPLWTVHALIPTDSRPTLAAIRVPSPACPEPAPFAPLAVERLEVNARVGRDGKLGTYWNAAGMAVSSGRRSAPASDAA